MQIEELEKHAVDLGISWDDTMKSRLIRYAELLKEWNQKMNLTAVDEPEMVYEKHFLDCMLPLQVHFPGNKICDVGSGAGFPGMVFAIADPDLQATLVEPTGKRCRFLEEVIKELDLKNVTVLNERAEEHVMKFRAYYDVVCARAVAGLPVLAELCIPLVRKDGIFLAMKGDKGLEEAIEGTFAVKTLGCRESGTIMQNLPDGSERVLLVYRKEKDTPEQYPRPYAKIRKKPLGSRK